MIFDPKESRRILGDATQWPWTAHPDGRVTALCSGQVEQDDGTWTEEPVEVLVAQAIPDDAVAIAHSRNTLVAALEFLEEIGYGQE